MGRIIRGRGGVGTGEATKSVISVRPCVQILRAFILPLSPSASATIHCTASHHGAYEPTETRQSHSATISIVRQLGCRAKVIHGGAVILVSHGINMRRFDSRGSSPVNADA
ncbi:unnamed protein product [Protopolystoma xenopodis]|uniref:Uncharacterized protein n=1 Tax=Protopolystoma xenopodis TaxID=117903 RepID=A0A3S4ZR48_9PLAT|nr:unnamed protein product [Protopolystoma xenopodis]